MKYYWEIKGDKLFWVQNTIDDSQNWWDEEVTPKDETLAVSFINYRRGKLCQWQQIVFNCLPLKEGRHWLEREHSLEGQT